MTPTLPVEEFELLAERAGLGGLDREALRLLLVDGRSPHRIAQLLGIRVDVAATALASAHDRLRALQGDPSPLEEARMLLEAHANIRHSRDHGPLLGHAPGSPRDPAHLREVSLRGKLVIPSDLLPFIRG